LAQGTVKVEERKVMSCVCILAPVVIAAWPTFSAAIVAAATSLGYEVVSDKLARATANEERNTSVRLGLEQSELVTDQLGRDQRLTVSRDGVTITFSRDERGKASICVEGTGQDETTLRSMGEQLGQRVVQQYVYQRLMEEMRTRQFVVVDEEVDANHAIRLKVRHWN
jgi:hypothetical protein